MIARVIRIGLPAAMLLALAPPSPTLAQNTATPTLRQELMQSCNADAGARDLSGEARRIFMERCLAGLATPSAGATMTPGSPTPAQAAQLERMRECNADAGRRNLAGEQRQRFMSDCLADLSGAGASATTGGGGGGD